MTHQSSFSVATPRDFLEQVVVPQYEDFLASNSSPRHALLSIIATYHMIDWVLKKRGRKQKDEERTDFIAARMPPAVSANHEIARKITNGTKHFENRIKTRAQEGSFSSAFSAAFTRTVLMVERDDGSEISADELLESLVSFWKDQQAKGLF